MPITVIHVIHKNENKGDEMTEIIVTLPQYVPRCGDHLLKIMKLNFKLYLHFSYYCIIIILI